MTFKYFHCFLIFVLGSPCFLIAQKQVDSLPIEYGQLNNDFKILFSNNTGVEWEQKLNKVSSLVFFGGYSLGRKSDNYRNRALPIILSPDAYVEYRNYYDLLKRADRHKSTYNNSGEFLFGRVESVFAVSGQNTYSLLFTQGWGTQRSLTKHMQIGLQAGVVEHFFFDKPVTGGFNYIRFEPMLSIVFSFPFQFH